MSDEYDRFVQIVNDLRGEGIFTSRLVPLTHQAEPYDHLQSLVESCGFRMSPLQEIGRELANAILVSLLHRDLAYDHLCMPVELASRTADMLLTHFNTDDRYFTNAQFQRKDVAEPASLLVQISGWNPLTESTFDSGVVCIGSELGGIYWFQDED